MTAKKLYVGQLPKGCTSQMLSEIFEKFGTVSECDVIRNYGFVHMTNETEAQEAVTNLDDSNFMGSSILVQFSTTDVHKAPGVGSQGECFRCGKRGHLSRECPEGGTKPRRRGPRGGGGRGGSRSGGGYGGSRDRGHSSRDYWDSYYYDYPPPRRLPPPGYDYDRRPPYPRDYPYPPAAYRDRSRSPTGRRPPSDPYMRRGRSPPREYRDYYDRPPMSRDYYDMPPPRRDAPVSYPLPPAYNRDPYPERPRYRPDNREQAPPHRPPFPSKSPIANPIAPPKRLPFAYANGNSAKPAGQVNGTFTEDDY